MPALITPADRIFLAGHRGMVGSAICRALQRAGYTNLLTASRAALVRRSPILSGGAGRREGGRYPGQQQLSG